MGDENIFNPAGIAAVPIVFGGAQSSCFGWFHAPQAPVQGMGVVLCRPVGYEGMCAYDSYTHLAEKLAAAGFAVIRFDYHGTGNSAGTDTDPNRIRAWVESTQWAIDEVKRLGNISRIALFGVRFGATLAVAAATALGGVDCMILWAPCVTGRAFARELRVSSSRLAEAADASLEGGIEALGCVFTAQTLAEMQTLDCQRLSVAPAKRVLLVGRDDLPIEGPLPSSYRSMGVDTTYMVLPGYANMIIEPHEGSVTHETLDVMVEWLRVANSAATASCLPVDSPRTYLSTVAPVDTLFGGVRERTLTFGAGNNLFGILSEPAQLPTAGHHLDTAVLMLSVGTNHHIGPNRLYVKMARSLAAQGYRSLRFDLTGIGDSRSAVDNGGSRLYSKGSTVDVQAAIDCMSLHGCKRFVLLGLCSGAYVAFQTAILEARVSGVILLNPRRLEWKLGETLQSAMQVSYKSTHFYKKALLQPDVYMRILRGQVDVRGIAGRMWVLLKARLKRVASRVLQKNPAEEDVLANAKLLSSKGTNTLMIVGAEDDGRDYIEFHFGMRGKKLDSDPHFEMAVMDGADHTFSNTMCQQMLIDLIQQHMDRTDTSMRH